MNSKKDKKFFRKIEAKEEPKKDKVVKVHEEDLSRFTIPSETNSQNVSVDEKKEDFDVIQEDISGNNSFWSTGIGKIWMSVFALCLIFAVLIGFQIFQTVNKNNEVPQTSSPTGILTTTKTLTPTPETVDFSKYKIEVLNGSGKSGEAAAVKSLLEKDKIIVGFIGNAKNGFFEKSVVSAKKIVNSKAISQIKESLAGYQFEKDSILEDSEEYDIIITIGSSKTP